MFNTFCYYLNVIHLSRVAEGLRRLVAAVTPTVYKEYRGVQWSHGDGYRGWIESPLGVVAFVPTDGKLQWRW